MPSLIESDVNTASLGITRPRGTDEQKCQCQYNDYGTFSFAKKIADLGEFFGRGANCRTMKMAGCRLGGSGTRIVVSVCHNCSCSAIRGFRARGAQTSRC